MQTIYLVRHGTTEWMELHKIQGASNSPLSPRGQLEAQKTAQALERIKFDAVYCSPLGRTRETAADICQARGCQPVIIEDLREIDFGWLEGGRDFNAPNGKLKFIQYIVLLARFLLIQISGERFAQVKKRAANSWQIIQQRCPRGTILIVAHGVLLHYLIGGLLSAEERKQRGRFHLQPCSISELEVDDTGTARVIRLNDTRHLAPEQR